MFGKLFKPIAHNVFDYKPRYYNPREARLRQLEKQYSEGSTLNSDQDPLISLSKTNLRQDWARNKRADSNRSSNLRLALIIAILVAIVAYLFDLHKLL